MYKKIFLIMLLFLLASCSSNNENIIPQNNITDTEVSKTSDLDLVKKYFTHLSKKDYLLAYNLKETDQTFEEFKGIYSDSRVFIQYSSEELENGNIKTINIIDDVPYRGIFKMFNGKIKTISVGEMKDYIYKNGKLRKKIVSEKYPNVNYFPLTRFGNQDYLNDYLIIYISKNRSDLLNKKIVLHENFFKGMKSELNITFTELINKKLNKNNLLNGILSKKRRDNIDGVIKEVSEPTVSIKISDNKNLIIEEFELGNKNFYYIERLDENNIVLYVGNKEPKYSKEELLNIFNELKEERLSKLNVGDCYIYQSNMNCINNEGKEEIKIEYNKKQTETCKLVNDFIFKCDNYMSNQAALPADIYFLKSGKIIKSSDFGYSEEVFHLNKKVFSYKKHKDGIAIFYGKNKYNDGIMYYYDVNGDLVNKSVKKEE